MLRRELLKSFFGLPFLGLLPAAPQFTKMKSFVAPLKMSVVLKPALTEFAEFNEDWNYPYTSMMPVYKTKEMIEDVKEFAGYENLMEIQSIDQADKTISVSTADKIDFNFDEYLEKQTCG